MVKLNKKKIKWLVDQVIKHLMKTPNIAFIKKSPNLFAIFWRSAEYEKESAKKY